MEHFAEILTNALANGESLEDALSDLRARGASPVAAIKAIHIARGVSLGEAKQIFGRSAAWTREIAAGDVLHKEIFSMLAKEKDS